MFIMLEMSLFCIRFLNVTVDAASLFSEVKFLNCLHRFFDGVFRTVHLFYELN